MSDPRDFMEGLKIDLYSGQVFVFTPKGDVIDLPAGSTPIDFAYAIHTEVGHRCVGARVNGRLVPLDYELQTGDSVEVIMSKAQDAAPTRDWLSIVQSPRARTKIRQWFSRERREDALETGRDLLQQGAAQAVAPGGATAVRGGRWQQVASRPQVPGPRRAVRGDRRRPGLAAVDRVAVDRGSCRTRPRRRPRRSRPSGPSSSSGRTRAGIMVQGRSDVWVKLCEVLHARAGRPDHRVRHAGPRRQCPPRGLSQRPGAPTRARPADRGRLAGRGRHIVRRHHPGGGARPAEAPARRRHGAWATCT